MHFVATYDQIRIEMAVLQRDAARRRLALFARRVQRSA